jgi:hypothetical protein
MVRREGGGWTLIRQMDHASHCGEIARAWRSGPFGAGAVSAALEDAAGRHDLGWDEVDGDPEIGDDGAPRNFTQFDEARHARFYAGAVRTIAQTNPHAAYLVSLHASGLYSRRYAWRGFRTMDWTTVGSDGRALLAGERLFREGLARSLDPAAVEFEQAWRDYMLLETFDFLSLLTCFGLPGDGCGPVPTIAGRFADLVVTRDGTWEVRLDPFPFAGDHLELPVTFRHLHGDRFGSDAELRDRLRAARSEVRSTLYRAAS